MARSEGDRWDVASSVGATATLVAAARALATRQGDPLIDDRFAEPLVRAVGIEAFIAALDGRMDDQLPAVQSMVDMISVRTRFFDDFFLDATAAGLRQAVILASGLDARAYRLEWPVGTSVFEVDQPEVIEFKSGVLAAHEPRAQRRTVAVDLREDWPAALRAHGFDASAPTAWIAEGLLVYLPPDAQDRLFDHIDTLSPSGSRLATEYHPDGGSGIAASAATITGQLAGSGLDFNLAELFYDGERTPVTAYLEGLGWDVTTRPRSEMFTHYGRTYPDLPTLQKSLCVTAVKR